MAVKTEDLIKIYEDAEEFEDEIAGIKNLTWDLSTFSKNNELIKHKLEILFTHIKEEMSRIGKIIETERETIESYEKHGERIEDTPIWVIYQGSLTVRESLKKIISILSIQLDTLLTVNEKLVSILEDVRKFGYEKQKVELEIEVLRNVTEHMKSFMEQERNYRKQIAEEEKKAIISTLEESIKNFSLALEKTNVLLSNLITSISQLRYETAPKKDYETELRTLHEKIESILENMPKKEENVLPARYSSVEKLEPEIKPLVEPEIEKEQEIEEEPEIEEVEEKFEKEQEHETEKEFTKPETIFEAMKYLMFEKNITDKVDMFEELKKMGFKIKDIYDLGRHGYNALLKKYKELKSSENLE